MSKKKENYWNRYQEPAQKDRLIRSFHQMSKWADWRAETALNPTQKQHFQNISKAALSLTSLQYATNPEKEVQQSPGLQDSLNLIVETGNAIKQRPEGDAQRTNGRYRASLRIIDDFVTEASGSFNCARPYSGVRADTSAPPLKPVPI